MHFPLDHRTSEDIFKYTMLLARTYCPEWTKDWPEDDDKVDIKDFRVVLLQLFAELSETLIKQLNQIPYKYLVAFLDLMGIYPLSAVPARAPLSFYLAEGAHHTYVNQNIQVASSENGDIIFEVEEDLLVVKTPLAQICSINPWYGKFTRHSLDLEIQKQGFYIFGRDNNEEHIKHILYLGDIFLFDNNKNVDLTIKIKGTIGKFEDYFHIWKNSEGKIYNPEVKNENDQITLKFVDLEPLILSEQDGQEGYWLSVEPDLTTAIITRENINLIPEIEDISSDLKIKGTLPQGVVVNDAPIEPEKGFFPFGENPKRLDTCYIASKNFEKEGALISLNISFQEELHHINSPDYLFKKQDIKDLFLLVKRLNDRSRISKYLKGKLPPEIQTIIVNEKKPELLLDAIVQGFNLLLNEESLYEEEAFKDVILREEILYKTTKSLKGFENIKFNRKLIEDSYSNEILRYLEVQLNWEYWDGEVWKNFVETSQQEDEDLPPLKQTWEDNSRNFTQNGKISFICPRMKLLTINGLENYWIRTRIEKGVYGTPGGYTKTKDLYEILEGWEEIINILVKEGITSGVRYNIPEYTPPFIKNISIDIEYSNKKFEFIKNYSHFEYLDLSKRKKFRIYEPTEDENPALYLGFNENISSTGFTVYFALNEIYSEKEIRTLTKPSIDNLFVSNSKISNWKYYNGQNWVLIEVENGNSFFETDEICKFYIPQDIQKVQHLGYELYWFRIELEGDKVECPYLKGIHFNTVWAKNTITIENELLGSGNNTPNLTFKLSQVPVLENQQILVGESKFISQKEQNEILSEEGEDAIFHKGGLYWVCWHQVRDFGFSTSFSRHYTIDRINGNIVFGDGTKGMIPPLGTNNIIAKRYQSGGGKQGNVAEETITDLTTAIPMIDSVINHRVASGGNDQELLEDAVNRGPQALKSKDRAVTEEDFEWLAQTASQEVAKAKCIKSERGKVTIAIVPSDENEMHPTQALINLVEKYLKQRALTAIEGEIKVIAPKYESIDISMTLTPKSFDQIGKTEEKVLKNINNFLHPIKGGKSSNGWEFGDAVYLFDIIKVINEIEEVDNVNQIILRKMDKGKILQEVDGISEGWINLDLNALPIPGNIEITINSPLGLDKN